MQIESQELGEGRIYYPSREEIDRRLFVELKKYLLLKEESALSFQLLKEDKGQVHQILYHGETLYSKYYQFRSIGRTLKRFFRGPYAVKNLRTALKLLEAGIPSVLPVGSIVYKKGLFSLESIFIMREVEGVNLFDYLKRERIDKAFIMKLTNKLAKLSALLLKNNFYHSDPNLFNLFLSFREEESILTLIDIDNIYELPLLPERILLENLVLFHYRMVENSLELPFTIGEREMRSFCNTLYQELELATPWKRFYDRIQEKTIERLKKRGLWEIYQDRCEALRGETL